ncbi:alpha/beta hydrolase family protein [Arcobacter vandammei]|uniref:alpha/beta hydrolase family protein n=1 Tax=Arcobacter vandammei TaxID=2782243 RepID=UPI001D17EEE5|nr:alpha/beta fold hydrolase [Arcobacter vandammei]
MKKILLLTGFLFASSLFANVSKSDCENRGEDFVFAKGECINFKTFEGENSGLTIIVHGTWDEGTDIIARYSPFAEDIAMSSDVTTLAIALPGYSKSSSNHLKAIGSKEVKNLAAKKEYAEFFVELVEALKEKFDSPKTTVISHSAGCMLSATAIGLKPNLVDNLVCAGGNYDIHKKVPDDKSLISAVDVVDNISKDTKIAIVYGTQDDISTPQMNKDFYELAKKKGLNVELIEVKDAPHMELEMTKEAKDYINKLLED